MAVNKQMQAVLLGILGLSTGALAYKGRGKGFLWYLQTPLYVFRKVRHVRDVYRSHEQFIANSAATGIDNEAFQAVLQSSDTAVMGKGQLFLLYQLALNARNVPGDIAELGVYQGGTARMLAELLPEKLLHLFDTFEGMPATGLPYEFHQAGDFSETSLTVVQAALKHCPNVRFYAGFFPETAQAVKEQIFSLVHLDGDLYQSTKDGCAFFYPRMSPGGVIVFHDYGLETCPGVRHAVDEFFADKPERVLSVGTYQALAIKQA